MRELEKDVSEQARKTGRTNEKTQFGIFVLHNKDKPKKGELPEELMKDRYWAAETIPDLWVYALQGCVNGSVNIHGRHGISLNILKGRRHKRLD